MPVPDAVFDVKLNGLGYLLARSEQLAQGARAWQVRGEAASVARPGTEDVAYGGLSPLLEFPMVFHGGDRGYGDEKQQLAGRFYWSTGIDTRWPGTLTLGPRLYGISGYMRGMVVGMFEQADRLYVVGGRYCKRINPNGTVTTDKDFGAGAEVWDCCSYNGDVYVTMGYGQGVWKRSHQGAWTQSAEIKLGYIASFKDRVWASTSPSTVASAATGLLDEANWTSRYQVGETTSTITDLVEMDDVLYIGKTDGLYGWDGEIGFIQLLPEVQGYNHVWNCSNLFSWHGALFVPHIRGLFMFRPGGENGNVILAATPGRDTPIECPIRGMVTALAGDAHWLYAAILNERGDTYLLAGKEATDAAAGLGPVIWHPIAHDDDVTCRAMYLTGVFDGPRLYFGAGPDIDYLKMVRMGDNPLNDPQYPYESTGSIYFPAHDMGAPSTPKVYKSVEVMGRNLATGVRWVELYYRTNRNRNWIPVTIPAIERKAVAILNGGAGVVAESLEVRLDLERNTSVAVAPLETTPVVDGIIIRGAERSAVTETLTVQVRIADNLRGKGGIPIRRSGATMLGELKALAKRETPVLLVDTLGTSRYVLVVPPVEEVESRDDKGESREVIATVHMVEFGAEITASSIAYTTWGYTGTHTGPNDADTMSNSIISTHTGANNQAMLTDAAATYAVNELVGYLLHNVTDGSSGYIISNTANTITVTLAGGTQNDFDTGDIYNVDRFFPNLGLIGYTCMNLTDGSSGVVVTNGLNTVIAAWTGGTENKWDKGDRYRIYALDSIYGGSKAWHE